MGSDPENPVLRYEDGKDIERYSGSRSYDHLAQFINTHSKRYVRSLGEVPLDAAGQAVLLSSSGVNPEGIAEEVNQERLAELKAAGPVFVKFYAPW
mgnify:CR=1 FL=1